MLTAVMRHLEAKAIDEPRYLMSPERPAVVHGMPARYLVP